VRGPSKQAQTGTWSEYLSSMKHDDDINPRYVHLVHVIRAECLRWSVENSSVGLAELGVIQFHVILLQA
jgi:hypothetical protein